MADAKVKRYVKKDKITHRYKADHKQRDNEKKDCAASVTVAEKKTDITKDCPTCKRVKAKFKYEKEVTLNSLK
jgi:hypothetical protein